jgi:hypothetical protein
VFQLAEAEVSRRTNRIVAPGGVTANFLDSERLITIARRAVTPPATPKRNIVQLPYINHFSALPALIEEPFLRSA